MELSEEVKAMIENKICSVNNAEFIGEGIMVWTFDQIETIIHSVLSDPELLSKAGWVKKEEWISVSERLPEFGLNVLVRGEARGMNPQMGGAYTFICSRKNLKGTSLEKQSERYIEKNQFAASYVTHWLPLPSPPQNK